MFTIPTEALFNRSPLVARSALVGIGSPGRQQPAIVLELEPNATIRGLGKAERDGFMAQLRQAMHQTGVRHLLIYPRKLPVDIRHNAKIWREQLAVWAASQLRRARSPRCIVLKDVS